MWAQPMPSKMQDLRLFPKLVDLSRQGQELALELERGQAATPLSDHCAAVVDELSTQAGAVVLVASSLRTRSAALSWLVSGADGGAHVAASVMPALTELRLDGEGFALVGRQGARQEFADQSSFITALDALWAGAEAVAPQSPESTAGGPAAAAAPAHRATSRSLTILVPDSLSAVSSVVGLAAELQARAQCLLVAHSETSFSGPSEETAGQIRQLAQGMSVLAPMPADELVPPRPEGAAAAEPRSGSAPLWWRELEVQGVSTLKPLKGDPKASVAALQASLPAWRLQAAVARLRLSVEAIKERVERDARQLQSRKQREDDEARVEPAGDAVFRRPFEQVRNLLTDEVAALGRQVADSSRRNLLPEGVISRGLSQQIKSLEQADLEREESTKVVRLSLAAITQAQLLNQLKRLLKDELSQDLSSLREALNRLTPSLESSLEEGAQTPVRLGLVPPSESDIWSQIGEMVNIEIRYRGELPKRGFLQRLGEGRKAVFAGMMVLSLLGSFAGFNARGVGAFGVVFLIVFIVAIAMTYRSWKQEDAERLDKELEKVREQLLAECRRMIQEVQREKQSRLTAYLDQLKRQVMQRVDELQRDRQQKEQLASADRRERARRRKEQLDRQIRDGQTLAQRVGRLLQDLQRLAEDAASEALDVTKKQQLLS